MLLLVGSGTKEQERRFGCETNVFDVSINTIMHFVQRKHLLQRNMKTDASQMSIMSIMSIIWLISAVGTKDFALDTCSCFMIIERATSCRVCSLEYSNK